MTNKGFSSILISVFLLCVFKVNSQNISFIVGDEKKTGLLETTIGIVGLDDEHIYCMSSATKGMMLGPVGLGVKGKISLDVYNYNLQAVQSVQIPDIELEIVNSAKTSFEFFAEDEEKNLYLYYSDKDGKDISLKRRILDKKDYKFINTETVSVMQVSGINSDRRGTFGAFSSPENNYKAIFSWTENNSQGKEVYVEMLDRNLTSIWKKEIGLPFELQQGFAKLNYLSYINGGTSLKSKSRITVSEDGVLCLLIHAFDSDKQVLGKKESDFYLVSINEKDDIPDIKKITLEEKEIKQLNIKNLSNGNLLCAGYYSNKKSKEIDGIYYFEYDPRESKVIKTGTIQLNKQDKSAASSTFSNPEKQNMLDLLIGPDGSFTLISEYYSYNTASQNYQPTHHFGNIALINCSSEGHINWIQTVKKKQIFPSPMLLSTKIIEQNNSVMLLYNTLEKATFRKISGKIMCSIIDHEGKIAHKVITEFGDDEPLDKKYISPLSLKQTSREQYTGIVYSLKNNPSLIQFTIQ